MANFKALSIDQFLINLAAKQPSPGGGAAAAIGASIGSAAAQMAAAYTQRKKDKESGSAAKAVELVTSLDISPLLQAADDDAAAYKACWTSPCGFVENFNLPRGIYWPVFLGAS